MADERKVYNFIEDFLKKIRAKGRYSFTYQELMDTFDISNQALDKNLYRLKQKGEIASVRKGFYLIIPPEYSSVNTLPVNLFIDDLMHSFNREYYIGLFSAAALHGASHQQIMESFVMIKKPAMRSIRKKNFAINFNVKKDWNTDDIVQKKTDAGYINVSSPELTALDFLYYSGSIGINRSFTVLQELYEVMKPSLLLRAAKNYPRTASIQRLGYIIDRELKREDLANSLRKVLRNRKLNTIPLSPKKEKEGLVDKEWKILVNIEIEGDL